MANIGPVGEQRQFGAFGIFDDPVSNGSQPTEQRAAAQEVNLNEISASSSQSVEKLAEDAKSRDESALIAASNQEQKNHAQLNQLAELMTELQKSVRVMTQQHKLGNQLNGSPATNRSIDSPGKEKPLANSIKKMFKGVGLLAATGLTIVGGMGFMVALCTGQLYALPALALMTGIGYMGVKMIEASEEAENAKIQAQLA